MNKLFIAGLFFCFAAPDAFAASYSYDAAGRLLSVVASNGATVSYQYDSAGNMTRKVVSLATSTTTLSVSPATLAFAPVVVGQSAPTLALSVTNTGQANLVVNAPSINSPFILDGNSCATPVPPAASCTISVRFTPSAAVTTSASFAIVSNATGSPHLVTLTGTGLPAADNIPPSTPGTPSATPTSSSQIDLAWAASTDTGGSGLADYRIERCTGQGCNNFVQVGTSFTNSYGDVGLSAGATYMYRVRAFDIAGNPSLYSSSISATTFTSGPVPVCVLSATPTSGPVGASFALAANCTNTPISYAWTSIGNAPTLISSASAAPSVIPTFAGTFSYQLVATNASSPSAPTTVSITVDPPVAGACNGQGNVIGDWIRYGSATYNSGTNTYVTGDAQGGGDTADIDGDCNPANVWDSGTKSSGQAFDIDWMTYKNSTAGSIDFSWQGCVGKTNQSYDFVGLGVVNPLFTSLPNSRQQPVSNIRVAFGSRWESPLLQVIVNDVFTPIANTAAMNGSYCGTFRVLRTGTNLQAYYNGTLVGSGTDSGGTLVPVTRAWDSVHMLTPTITIGDATMLARTGVQSRKTHGSAGTFDLFIDTNMQITDPVTVEPRIISSGHNIVFQFNQPITTSGAVAAVDAASVAIGATAVAAGNEVTVTLADVPNATRVTVSLTGVNGTFNTSASLGFLMGDSNNSRSVNSSDISGVKARSGQATTAANFQFDVNASGSINSSDISAVKARSGMALGLPSTTFADNFDGTSLQSAYWTPIGPTVPTVVGGLVNFACNVNANTSGKFVISGDPIIIEARFVGAGSLRDTAIWVVDVSNPANYLQVGDTTYQSAGLYTYGAGIFAMAQLGTRTSVNVFKEYRLTITGTALTWQRGDTVANLTETRSVTLPASIAGKSFYLIIGTGGPDYCPGTFDWIRVMR